MRRMQALSAQNALPAMNLRGEIPQIGLKIFRLSDPGRMGAALAGLQRVPEVLYAEPARRVILLSDPNDPYFNQMDTDPNHVLFPPDTWPYQWPLQFVHAASAWAIWPGSYYTAATKPAGAVKVAVIDTGVDTTHPDFINAGGSSTDALNGGQLDLTDGRNLINGGDNPTPNDPTDEYGHGTHVAGIIGAATNNGEGIAALGFNAQIMPLKVLDASGSGTDADVIGAMIFAADHGALIINLSLAADGGYSQALQDAVNYCWSHNTLVVAAAGNDGTDIIRRYPAACDKVLAVAATAYYSADTVPDYEWSASYSNFGLYIGIAAPGGDASYWNNIDWGLVPELNTLVWSTTPTDITATLIAQGITESTYGYLNGTSMASPHAAGLAALYAGYKGFTQATPDAPRKIIRAIQRGADNIYGTANGAWTTVFGHGRINALATMMETFGDGRSSTTPGCITGQVTYSSLPIVNASVTAQPQGGTARYNALSQLDGTYRIANIPPGSYNLTCQYLSYVKTGSVVVEAACDAVATDFELSAASISVTVSPHAASVPIGGTQQFTADVTGSPNGVAWSVTDGPGSIDSTGLYYAPTAAPATYTAHVKAFSVDDPTKSDTATVTITPALSSVTLNPTAVVGGMSSIGTVTMIGVAPAGGTTVALSSSSSAATIPGGSVTIPQGSSSAKFTVNTTSTPTGTMALIMATLGGITKSATLTINPSSAILTGLTLTPNPANGGYNVTGKVTLSALAPAGGASVSLASANPAAHLPAGSAVTVPAGSAFATFTLSTDVAISSQQVGLITATLGAAKSVMLAINPIKAASVWANPNPAPLTRGSSLGRVYVTVNAPPGGVPVTLQSTNPAVATLPAGVTVPAGANTVSFTITLKGTGSTTLKATAGGVTVTRLLTVN
jgi:subtilisin family serine protease